jgi:hypothetical protein
MVHEGKSEADAIAARPLKDLDARWAASDEAAVAFTKMVLQLVQAVVTAADGYSTQRSLSPITQALLPQQ